ncbi:UNVERIFIED_CONTAM: hypothetical protein K2H54_045576 [Gekko kuhli]
MYSCIQYTGWGEFSIGNGNLTLKSKASPACTTWKCFSSSSTAATNKSSFKDTGNEQIKQHGNMATSCELFHILLLHLLLGLYLSHSLPFLPLPTPPCISPCFALYFPVSVLLFESFPQ